MARPSPPGRRLLDEDDQEEWETTKTNHPQPTQDAASFCHHEERNPTRNVPQNGRHVYEYHNTNHTALIRRKHQSHSLGSGPWQPQGAMTRKKKEASYKISPPSSPQTRHKRTMSHKYYVAALVATLFIISIGFPTTIHVFYLPNVSTTNMRLRYAATRRIAVTSPRRLLLGTLGDDTVSDVVVLAPRKRTIKRTNKPNYGGLDYQPSTGNRTIDPTDDDLFESYRDSLLQASSNLPHESRNSKDDNPLDEHDCANPSFVGVYRPNCNSFHEIDFGRPVFDPHARDRTYDIQLLGHGSFRDAWILRDESGHLPTDDVIIKQTRYKREIDYSILEQTTNDAMVMEVLSASPYIVNMHGYCGGSVSVETLEREVESHQVLASTSSGRRAALTSQIALNATQKLNLALDMAKGIASLHGHPEGPIVDVDVAPKQWMFTTDGRAKLGDFNQAEALQWHSWGEFYCEVPSDHIGGYYRSPEEYRGEAYDEKIDVYSLGNALYAILTGKTPYDELVEAGKEDTIRDEIIHGRLIPMDKSHLTELEERLAAVIQRCLATKPWDRIDIFEVVRMLDEIQDLETKS